MVIFLQLTVAILAMKFPAVFETGCRKILQLDTSYSAIPSFA